MTTIEKNKRAQQIASEGELLINKAELLLQNVAARNTKLTKEVKEIKEEIVDKTAREQVQSPYLIRRVIMIPSCSDLSK